MNNPGKLFELVFFPSFCKRCSVLLEIPEEKVICRACLEMLRPKRSSFCVCCGSFFEVPETPHLCASCLNSRPPFSLHRSCHHYQGVVKDVILLFKYRKYRVLGKTLAHFVFESLGKEEDLWWEVEGIVPVPLHPKRQKQRGFNQAQDIARELARIKGIEVIENQLRKKKNVLPQTTLSGLDRQKNVKGAFEVQGEDRIKGKVLLLVDDVYTTGATIKECTLVLLKAGAKEIRALTVAQA